LSLGFKRLRVGFTSFRGWWAVRVVTFKVDERLLDELDRYAARKRITRSDAIRKAIIELLMRDGSTRYFPGFTIRKVVVY